jgi:hypothetical protein
VTDIAASLAVLLSAAFAERMFANEHCSFAHRHALARILTHRGVKRCVTDCDYGPLQLPISEVELARDPLDAEKRLNAVNF